MSIFGHRPTDKGESGPYAYADTDDWFGGGFGLWNYGEEENGKKSSAGSVYANGGVGTWKDAGGETNYGVGLQGGLYKGESRGKDSGVDGGIGTFSAGAQANKNTASLGVQANAVEGAVTFGGSDNVRVGLSAGWGMGGRVHYGDTDNDGNREYGFGFDAGPLSFDAKSESISELARWWGD